MIVIGMELAVFLIAMQRNVGGIDIHNQFSRDVLCAAMTFSAEESLCNIKGWHFVMTSAFDNDLTVVHVVPQLRKSPFMRKLCEATACA